MKLSMEMLFVFYVLKKRKRRKIMKYKVDEWVTYNPLLARSGISDPKKAVILYVYKKSERSFYDYEIYIDETPGIHKKVRESSLYPPEK